MVSSDRCSLLFGNDIHCAICSRASLHASHLPQGPGWNTCTHSRQHKCELESPSPQTPVSRHSDVSVDPLDHSLVNAVESIGYSISHSLNQLMPSIECERQFAPLVMAVYEMCPFITQKVEEFENAAIEVSNFTQQRVKLLSDLV